MAHPEQAKQPVYDPLFVSAGTEDVEYPRSEMHYITSTGDLANDPIDTSIEEDDEEYDRSTFSDADGLAPIVALVGMGALTLMAVAVYQGANKSFEYYHNNLNAENTNRVAVERVLEASKVLIGSEDAELSFSSSGSKPSWTFVERSTGQVFTSSDSAGENIDNFLTEQTLTISVLEDGLVELRENESWPVIGDGEIRFDNQGISFIIAPDGLPLTSDIEELIESLRDGQIKEVNRWSSQEPTTGGEDSMVMARRFSKEFLEQSKNNPYGLDDIGSIVIDEQG